MKHLEYNEENLKIISDLILKNLTVDLLPKSWMDRNYSNPTFGHCHTASGCLYKIFGSDAVNLYRALDDENIYHWWIIDKNNKIIDLTQDQYLSTGRTPPHDNGEKAGLLGFGYRKNVLSLLDRVARQYGPELSHMTSENSLENFFKN